MTAPGRLRLLLPSSLQLTVGDGGGGGDSLDPRDSRLRRRRRRRSHCRSRPKPLLLLSPVIRGWKNYGQTCFANAVLQSLASLEPFVDYIWELVIISNNHQQFLYEDDHEDDHDNHLFNNDDDDDGGGKNYTVSDMLWELLCNMNGITEEVQEEEEEDDDENDHQHQGGTLRRRQWRTQYFHPSTAHSYSSSSPSVDPRDILYLVACHHQQFRHSQRQQRNSIGKEQQDAQEFLQVLYDLILKEAQASFDQHFAETSSLSSILSLSSVILEDDAGEEDRNSNPKSRLEDSHMPFVPLSSSSVQTHSNDGFITTTAAAAVTATTNCVAAADGGSPIHVGGSNMYEKGQDDHYEPKQIQRDDWNSNSGRQESSTATTASLSTNSTLTSSYSTTTTTSMVDYDNSDDGYGSMSMNGSRYFEESDGNQRQHPFTLATTTPAGSPTQQYEQQQNDTNNVSSSSSSTLFQIVPDITTIRVPESPLHGWIGSTLQCCKCHHIRPIQNAPFLDIPIVPTALYHNNHYERSSGGAAQSSSSSSSPHSRLPSCTVEQCLYDFCAVERVQDVECLACTKNQIRVKLQEDQTYLRGAIRVMQRRKCAMMKISSTSGVGGGGAHRDSNDDEGLVQELELVENVLARLDSLDMETLMSKIRSFRESNNRLEEAGDDNNYYDDATAEDQQLWSLLSRVNVERGMAQKCFIITRLPSVLCLHVQRRFYDHKANRMAKTIQHVEFPEVLDVDPFFAFGSTSSVIPWMGTFPKRTGSGVDGSCTSPTPILYRLQSVLEHRGDAFHGHYVSYRRDQLGGWVLVSDETVTQVSWQQVRQCQAYMLFYQMEKLPSTTTSQ